MRAISLVNICDVYARTFREKMFFLGGLLLYHFTSTRKQCNYVSTVLSDLNLQLKCVRLCTVYYIFGHESSTRLRTKQLPKNRTSSLR